MKCEKFESSSGKPYQIIFAHGFAGRFFYVICYLLMLSQKIFFIFVGVIFPLVSTTL